MSRQHGGLPGRDILHDESMTDAMRTPERAEDPFHYLPAASAYDETFTPHGVPRPQQRDFWNGLKQLGASELSKRSQQGGRLIRENGVTYNVYGDPRGMDRPWVLDPIPLVLAADEWAAVSRGLDQRARLLNAILCDVYGPQRLLKEGLLPPELVFCSPSFLRPLHGFLPKDGVFLQLFAADLARAPDGRFWVLSNRAQAPSGAGYALENRLVVSRLLPQLFRDCRVERLAQFFSSVRDALAGVAPGGRESPRVVLLTPGPYNETYFEHAYLARYLGYTLVEGADLTVRDQQVYLKTLGGLERVDVIWRRLDDSYADPLSLRGDSSLGVAGLVQAVRRGNVSVANALGSGLVESPAMLAFLPSLCRHLLGEELALPSVATWWCGHREPRSYVLSHLDKLVIKSAFAGGAPFEPVFAGALSAAERQALIDRIEARPEAFVAEEQIALSTAPVWSGDSLQPRHVSLRTFLAHEGDGYRALPGGLARVSHSRDSLVVSMQRGGGSKDCWVLASGLPSSLSLLRAPGGQVEIVRSGADLPSRVADNLFWLGRYMERSEGMTRLLRSIVLRLTDDSLGQHGERFTMLLQALEDWAELPQDHLAQAKPARQLERRLFELLVCPTPARTLRATVESAFRAGSVARDRISGDTWRVVSLLQDQVLSFELQQRLHLQDALEVLNGLVLWFSAFNGLSRENMVHGPGWRFADIGRRIERALYTARLTRSVLVASDDSRAFDALLEVLDSTITYRTRYRGLMAFEAVLDLALTDETNPRSLCFQLAALDQHLHSLPQTERGAGLSLVGRTSLRALAAVRLADLTTLARYDEQGRRSALGELLGTLEGDLRLLADQLTLSYMAHAEPSVSLGMPAQGS